MSNIPHYQLNAASVTARNAEYGGTPLTDIDGNGNYNTYLGCNRAGSNAPGIGICPDVPNPKTDDWSTLDQAGAARDPQDSQHIGGNGLGAGDATNNPLNAIVDQNGTPDFNDTWTFEVAASQAAPGAGFGPANGDPVNRGSKTIQIGDRAWGTNTVA